MKVTKKKLNEQSKEDFITVDLEYGNKSILFRMEEGLELHLTGPLHEGDTGLLGTIKVSRK